MKEKIMNAKPLYHKTLFIYTLLFAVYTLFGRVTLLHGLVEHPGRIFRSDAVWDRSFILPWFYENEILESICTFYCLCRDIHRVECFLRCEKQPDNTDLAY